MPKENIWKLLARKMSGEATEEELRELQDMLKGDPEMNYTAETFCRLWNALPVQQTEETEAKNIGTNKRTTTTILKKEREN